MTTWLNWFSRLGKKWLRHAVIRTMSASMITLAAVAEKLHKHSPIGFLRRRAFKAGPIRSVARLTNASEKTGVHRQHRTSSQPGTCRLYSHGLLFRGEDAKPQ